ncbi:Flavonoid 3'-monooxygenase [Thalictrum thalictroides]|uniref:Flavonoid 3'-monooxygenase n=1 Tax=Thalictrum thalictroides TaxID=46969 RepID=A0A7J6UTR0_THATH|nr:Flavonoid 3'-monooxygenase [Thalictrum thalictroides]
MVSSEVIVLSTIFLASTIVYIFLNLHTQGGRRLPFPPGPKPWPIIGNLPHLGPVPHHSLAEMARKYGPFMHLRLGYVHVVVAASANVAAKFLKIHDANFSSRPPNAGAKYIAYNYQDLVFAPYGPMWRMLRKICSVHLFSSKALDDFRHVRKQEVAVLTGELMKSGSTTPVNLGQLLTVCATNALSRVLLGQRVFSSDGSGDKKSNEFKEMVVEMMVLAGTFNIGDFVPALEWLDLQGVVSKMKTLHKRFDGFLSKCIEDHNVMIKNCGEIGHGKHMDLLSTLIELKENGDGEGGQLTDTHIKALLLNLFTAGTDTSSSTVEWAIAELIRHPKILAKALEELDTVVGKERLLAEQKDMCWYEFRHKDGQFLNCEFSPCIRLGTCRQPDG